MYRIVTDGSCDLGTDLTKKLDVDVVPFYISLDGVNYQKEIAGRQVEAFAREIGGRAVMLSPLAYDYTENLLKMAEAMQESM